MLAWFDTVSLRWKLTAISLIAGALTIVLASGIIALYDSSAYRADKVGNSTAEAKVLAASVTASLEFDDAEATHEYLGALSADPALNGAAVYAANGEQVAIYVRVGTLKTPLPLHAPPIGSSFHGQELSVALPVVSSGRTVGTVLLQEQIESVTGRLARYAQILLAIGALSLALVLPLSLWLHRKISDPIDQLAARNAIIKATLDSVDHGVIVADSNGRVSFMNDRATAIFADAQDLAIGCDFHAFLSAWHKATGVGDMERDLAQLASSESARAHYSLPGGRAVECRQSSLPGGGFVRTYTDITEEVALQEQLQAAKEKAEQAAVAKSQFLAAMSHEIRTPMNGVIGIVELLRSTALNDEQMQMVEIIRQSGITLLDVINDILDYSKIEAGRMTVERTDCPLPEIVESTAGVVGGHTSSKFLDIVCKVDPRIDSVVIGDPVRIRQVILNLMGNAVKFTQKGAVSAEATLKSETEREIVVLFEVADTGLGIDAEKQKQLFQPFTQADHSTTRRFGGTGLGLSICKNLVELMGGEIGVRSELGKGSTFWFELPFTRLPPERRVDPYMAHRAAMAGMRVLVCDHIRTQPAASAYLRAVGVEVIEAPNVADAVSILRAEKEARHPVDAAVFRVRIGDDSSAQFSEEVKRYRELTETKIVLLIPHLSASSAKLATIPLFASSVTAPIQRVKLYDTVAAVTGRALAKATQTDDSIALSYVAPSVEEAVAQGCLILVAEDNQTNQFVIKSQLQRLGFAAEFVSDGREAWAVLSHNMDRYGMLITDCHMPYIDGYQLTGRVRDAEHSSGRRLPIVALTANALQGEAEICRAAGMDGYMFKPTNLPTLDAMVQKWLPTAARLRKPAAKASGDTVDASAKATPSGAGKPPIDLGALGQLLGNSDPDALREMVAMYWESESGTPAALQALIAARQGEALVAAAHGAKGAASSVCARAVADVCLGLERSAARADWETVDQLAVKLDAAFAEVAAFVETKTGAAAQ